MAHAKRQAKPEHSQTSAPLAPPGPDHEIDMRCLRSFSDQRLPYKSASKMICHDLILCYNFI